MNSLAKIRWIVSNAVVASGALEENAVPPVNASVVIRIGVDEPTYYTVRRVEYLVWNPGANIGTYTIVEVDLVPTPPETPAAGG